MLKKYSLVLKNKFYFVKIPYVTNKLKFMQLWHCKKGSYLYKTLENAYNFYCANAKNLYNDYRKYYKNEFLNFHDYLYKKHNLVQEEIKYLNNKFSYFKDYATCPHGNCCELLREPAYLEIFNSFFGGNHNPEEAYDEI